MINIGYLNEFLLEMRERIYKEKNQGDTSRKDGESRAEKNKDQNVDFVNRISRDKP